MTPGDLHHELARAAALAAATGGPCWHCGAPAPGRGEGGVPRCLDSGACFARQVAPPGGPPGHPTGRGACDPEEGPCSGCAAAYAEPDARDIEEDETV